MTQIELYTLAVSVLAGSAIPAVVDLIVKSRAPRSLKALAAFALSTLAGVLTTVQLAPRQTWQQYVMSVATAFVAAMAAHATGYSDPIQRRTARVGVGQHRKAA